MTLQILPGTRPSSLVFKQSPDIYCIILKQSLEDAKPTNHDYHTQLLNIRIGVCTESVLYRVTSPDGGLVTVRMISTTLSEYIFRLAESG